MNRNYAKLDKDNNPVYAPNGIATALGFVTNPTAEQCLAALDGPYYPVVADPPGEPPPAGYHYEPRGWEVADGSVRRVYAAVQDPPPPPRVFVTADLVEALMAEDVWEQARAWIVKQGMLDLVLATKEFDETNANFQAGKAALQTALGWTDAEVEELLAKCVKEGV